MSLTTALQTATSGLMAAQTGLRAVSDNIANVNTTGYVRKTVDQTPLSVAGVGMGVSSATIKRVTDTYLQLASLTAGSDSSRWNVFSQYLDNAQSLFGDPSKESFFFNRLDKVYAAFGAAANDPSSSLTRSQALADVQDFLSEADRINSQLAELGRTVDTRISADVDRANDLLTQINNLNADISRSKLMNGDASGSENIQSQLIDQLAGLMDVKITQQATGGVIVRSAEGVLLAGAGAARLAYNRTDASKGYISVTPPGGGTAQPIQINSGELRGLLDLRDTELPGVSDQLGEFVTRATDQLNAAHNASTAFPPPQTLTGRNTGLDLPTAIAGFSGVTTIAVTNASGVVLRKLTVDLTNGAMSIAVDGGTPSTTSAGSFLQDLDDALNGVGDADFVDGKLVLRATTGNGVAIDEGTSQKAGRGFSHFFGLNDLVRSEGFTQFDTGLRLSDDHGFVGNEKLTLRLAQGDGKPIRDVTIAMPNGGDMTSFLAALNDTATGVGIYGKFSLDSFGALTFNGGQPLNASISVIKDDTHRGVGGPSVSQLFGLGVAARSARAGDFNVDQDLSSDPTQLSLGKLDLSAAAGTPALRAGDGAGALRLAGAGDVAGRFSKAGSLGDLNMTVGRYAAEFGGSVGRAAAAAETRKASASAVQAEASARRESVEGVNLDEELVRLTTYQQAFSASARMIQAAKDLFDVLYQI